MRTASVSCFVFRLFVLACFLGMGPSWSTAETQVGVAKVDITPKHPVILAGYGSRTQEFEGIDSPLWIRALTIGRENPVAVIVVDNCGIPAEVTKRIRKKLQGKVAAERIVVAATHTHNAPSLAGYATILWAGRTTPEQEAHMLQYTQTIVDKAAEAVTKALAQQEPMQLEWTQGRATFGANRRVIQNGRWAGFGFHRTNPVDHSLPILTARNASGKVKAVWSNYACHCTTVGARNRIGGDWVGYANDYIEKQYPGATSLLTIGCGADVGPQPSGTLEIAKQHGRAIAEGVKAALAAGTTKLANPPEVSQQLVALPMEEIPTREEWQEQLENSQGFHQQLAKSMLAKLDKNGSIPSEVDYTISTWQFDDDLVMLFLGGEVVVDYAVRLNHELDWSRLWITGWANSMPGYIPSRRVLIEGGYEADFSQVYYDLPTRYTLAVEDILVDAITNLIGPKFSAAPEQPVAPFHQPPSAAAQAMARLKNWTKSPKTPEEKQILSALRANAGRATAAIQEISKGDSETTEWHDYAGDFRQRQFIRQNKEGRELGWSLPTFDTQDNGSITVCFTGGLGYLSDPKTDGFTLWINEETPIHFDVTIEAEQWVSEDGAATLTYLPTWTSDVDSGGFFFLRFQPTQKENQISVRSQGSGSQRWFAVDRQQATPERLKALNKALEE